MAEAGLEVFEDVAGNVFGIMKGEDETLPCVMMGSHYDSVKNGEVKIVQKLNWLDISFKGNNSTLPSNNS